MRKAEQWNQCQETRSIISIIALPFYYDKREDPDPLSHSPLVQVYHYNKMLAYKMYPYI